MKFIPALFMTDMVHQIIEGRKTKTRRLKGLEVINSNPVDWQFEWGEPLNNIWTFTKICSLNQETLKNKDFIQEQIKCPYGVPGDILWVRESYQLYNNNGGKQIYITASSEIEKFRTYAYEDLSPATLKKVRNYKTNKWISKPSIFLFKDFCRLFLEIKSIKVEQLQKISEADAKAEGAKDSLTVDDLKGMESLNWIIPRPFLMHQFGFLALWCKINGVKSWEANPWIWVITFKKVDRPADFITASNTNIYDNSTGIF